MNENHKKEMKAHGIEPWWGVDLDGCLAEYHEWGQPIGKPIHKMLARVYRWIGEGKKVKIFTARVSSGKGQIEEIREWLEPLGLEKLEITNVKDLGMVALYDDRCVQIIPNTGERADGKWTRDEP